MGISQTSEGSLLLIAAVKSFFSGNEDHFAKLKGKASCCRSGLQSSLLTAVPAVLNKVSVVGLFPYVMSFSCH